MSKLIDAQIDEIPGLTFDSASFGRDVPLDKLQVQLAETLKGLLGYIDNTYLRLLACPTAEDFRNLRKEVFPAYFKLSIALSNIILSDLTPVDYALTTQKSLTETEKELATKGVSNFGDEGCREILFCVSTLKNAYRWIPRLASTKPKDEAYDKELSDKYLKTSTWANFHLDCIKLTMERNQRVSPDVIQELLEGLRVSVIVYACVRTSLDLRGINDARYSEKLDVTWDGEDDALANAK